MKILVLSGKGGTGKTTLSNVLIEKLNVQDYADCDVDAPNLHLVKKLKLVNKTKFYGLKKYSIDQTKCKKCGKCLDSCNFKAIKYTNKSYNIDEIVCEGCSLCKYICPYDAIVEKAHIDGYTYLYKDAKQTFVSAKVKTGSGNSGKLVTEVKEQLFSQKSPSKYLVIDGSPGIGCPVIASINQMDFVVIVTEPSKSGFSDLKRIISTCDKMRIDYGVVINKYDLNKELTQEITSYLDKESIDLLGNISYSKALINKNNQKKYDSDDLAFKEIDQIVKKIKEIKK